MERYDKIYAEQRYSRRGDFGTSDSKDEFPYICLSAVVTRAVDFLMLYSGLEFL